MIQSIKNILFSQKLTALLLVVFFVAIGCATFIENDYGTPASKALVFNTKWFELILLLLAINMVGNMFKYKLFRLEKASTLMFHLAFIVIIIGAGITRYISFEGSMHIREGEMSNTIVSADAYLQFKVDDKVEQITYDKKLYLNPRYNSKFNPKFDFKGAKVGVAYKDFIPNSIDTVVPLENGKTILEIVTVGKGGRLSRFIESGQTKFFGNFPVAFNDNSIAEAIKISETDTGLIIVSPYDIDFMSMDDQSKSVIKKDSVQEFRNRRLYSIDNVQLVYKALHQNVEIKQISAPKENKSGEDALIVDVTCNDLTREVVLFGGQGYISNPTIFQLAGLNFSLTYGAKKIITPFNIRLNDFEMEKYPGSMSPSSFASEVTLVDNRFGGVEFDQRIFMNNVLDYDGYRLFQSSYDQDELGTVLSVNHDYWGTTITYIGYGFLFLGMILTFFMKKTRFNALRKTIKKLKEQRTIATVLLIGLSALLPLNSNAQHDHSNHKGEDHSAEINYTIIDADHADKFSRLLMQDVSGRMKPLHTFASEFLRKVHHKNKYKNLQPEQVLLSIMYNSGYWQQAPFIYINRNNEKLKTKLKAEGNYAAFINFFDKKFEYLLMDDVKAANAKRPAEQNQYDKDVLAVDERINICYMVYEGSILKLFPKSKDENNTWFSSLDYKQFTTHDSIFVKAILPFYYSSISKSIKTNDWSVADSTLKHIGDYQRKFGAAVIPEQIKIDMEISYNKINIFNTLFKYYPLIGLLMMFFLFSDIFNDKKWKKKVVNVLSVILFGLLIVHTAGLAARWYISGHAPWSNGYEAMLLVSWVALVMGFIFSKSNRMTLAASAILACVVLFSANLNFLDPQITNLVPVLKSYWLMIHVAIMVGSYAPLTLGALLAFINLLLMIFKTNKNKSKINGVIKELTCIIEMNLTIGLFMAAIGTFLGGIWANESWGRYWGWDPKETWALVIVLYYAMVLHLRFIPKANGRFLFNLMAVIGLSVVLMTYFGVNYYLSGLHSYAAGDPVPIPDFVPITAAVVLVIAVIAGIRNKKLPS
ncbi:MAG: cytochrome C biogenesis protein [Flavobacteriales bacterium]|nr:MAG: cytochrome C biogenesis protein [Flavobacteriales bacterium]